MPKKKFRSSVDRHRVRRLMVEAWRLNKQPLYEAIPAGTQMHLFFLFTGSKMPAYQEVQSVVLRAINKLIIEDKQPPAAPATEQGAMIPSSPTTLPPSTTEISSQ